MYPYPAQHIIEKYTMEKEVKSSSECMENWHCRCKNNDAEKKTVNTDKKNGKSPAKNAKGGKNDDKRDKKHEKHKDNPKLNAGRNGKSNGAA